MQVYIDHLHTPVLTQTGLVTVLADGSTLRCVLASTPFASKRVADVLCIVIKRRAFQRLTFLAPILMDLQVHRLSQPNPGPCVFWRDPRSRAEGDEDENDDEHASKQVPSSACTVRPVAIW